MYCELLPRGATIYTTNSVIDIIKPCEIPLLLTHQIPTPPNPSPSPMTSQYPNPINQAASLFSKHCHVMPPYLDHRLDIRLNRLAPPLPSQDSTKSRRAILP